MRTQTFRALTFALTLAGLTLTSAASMANAHTPPGEPPVMVELCGTVRNSTLPTLQLSEDPNDFVLMASTVAETTEMIRQLAAQRDGTPLCVYGNILKTYEGGAPILVPARFRNP